MSILQLTNVILIQIFKNFDDCTGINDLKNIRITCSRFRYLGAIPLFAAIDIANCHEDIQHAVESLTKPEIACCIIKVKIRTQSILPEEFAGRNLSQGSANERDVSSIVSKEDQWRIHSWADAFTTQLLKLLYTCRSTINCIAIQGATGLANLKDSKTFESAAFRCIAKVLDSVNLLSLRKLHLDAQYMNSVVTFMNRSLFQPDDDNMVLNGNIRRIEEFYLRNPQPREARRGISRECLSWLDKLALRTLNLDPLAPEVLFYLESSVIASQTNLTSLTLVQIMIVDDLSLTIQALPNLEALSFRKAIISEHQDTWAHIFDAILQLKHLTHLELRNLSYQSQVPCIIDPGFLDTHFCSRRRRGDKVFFTLIHEKIKNLKLEGKMKSEKDEYGFCKKCFIDVR